MPSGERRRSLQSFSICPRHSTQSGRRDCCWNFWRRVSEAKCTTSWVFFPILSRSKSEAWQHNQQPCEDERGCTTRGGGYHFTKTFPRVHQKYHNHCAKACLQHPPRRWLCSLELLWAVAHRIQDTVNKVSDWTGNGYWGWTKHRVSLTFFFIPYASKEKVKLTHADQQVPQIDLSTFLGATLDTRLTWKPHIQTSKLVFMLVINCNIPTTWRWAHGDPTPQKKPNTI